MVGIVRHFKPHWRWSAVSLLLLAGCASDVGKTYQNLAARFSPAGGTAKPAAESPEVVVTPGILSSTAATSVSQADSSIRPASAALGVGDTRQRVVSPEAIPAPTTPVGRDANPKPEARQELSGQSNGQANLAPDRMQMGQLNLPGAIDLAFRLQPRLQVYLAGIAQARGQSDVAFAPYLPTLSAGVSGGAYSLDVNGQVGGFSFFPPGASFPVGLSLQSGFALEEVKLQWLICDFGRRAGRYSQAQIAVEIARLQSERAYQTIANEVTSAYYQVLRCQALRFVAQEAVHRAVDDLDVARKLFAGGVVEREKVLRVEVQLAQALRLLDNAEAATAISVAALNLAIGVNVCSPTTVVPIAVVPSPPWSLCECLQRAVSQRRELDVARRGVQAAQVGQSVARAEFAPKIVGEGAFFNFQQGSPQSNIDLGLGFIKLEWGLFEGGKRVGEVRVADSKIRSAMSLAESIADTISFQITEAFRQMMAARQGIDRARPAVEQARENYRLVRARAAQGDATTAEITDAEAALTRAEQDYMTSTYDYLTAIARLEFAMGISPAESILHSGQ